MGRVLSESAPIRGVGRGEGPCGGRVPSGDGPNR